MENEKEGRSWVADRRILTLAFVECRETGAHSEISKAQIAPSFPWQAWRVQSLRFKYNHRSNVTPPQFPIFEWTQQLPRTQRRAFTGHTPISCCCSGGSGGSPRISLQDIRLWKVATETHGVTFSEGWSGDGNWSHPSCVTPKPYVPVPLADNAQCRKLSTADLGERICDGTFKNSKSYHCLRWDWPGWLDILKARGQSAYTFPRQQPQISPQPSLLIAVGALPWVAILTGLVSYAAVGPIYFLAALQLWGIASSSPPFGV